MTVPVLSSSTSVARPARSTTSPPFSRRPRCVASPVETITAIGVASPSAHGQAMTTTEMPVMSARSSGAPRASQKTSVAAARTSIAGTNTPTTRSATAWMRGFAPCASSTARTIPASTVSLPTRVTSTTSAPVPFTVPPITAAPGAFATGRDSPVTSDSSTSEAPSSTVPSSGTRSPGTTAIRSPGRISATGTLRGSSRPPAPRSSLRASRGASRASRATASDARPFAPASTNRPTRTSVGIIAAVSK